MKNILIPTDFSRNARNAIDYAMEFLKGERCTFYFLHTYTPQFYRMDYVFGGPSFSAIDDKGIDISLAGLEKTIADVKGRYANPNHTFEMVSAFNILSDEINELSESKSIDLVIMGTQGATGAKEIFLGSNAVHAIRKALVPVLVIPEGCSFEPIKNMLFPTDYLSYFRENDLQGLLEISRFHRALVTVLYVRGASDLTETQRKNKLHLDNCLAPISHSTKEIAGTNIPDAIINYSEANPINLIVMMNRKHSFMERLLTRQNIDQVGFHVKVPLLVIRDTAKA